MNAVQYWIVKVVCPEALMIREQGEAILNYKKDLEEAIKIIKEKNNKIDELNDHLDKSIAYDTEIKHHIDDQYNKLYWLLNAIKSGKAKDCEMPLLYRSSEHALKECDNCLDRIIRVLKDKLVI